MLAGKPCQQGGACWQALPARMPLLAMGARLKNRTPGQKGLRDRNSPTCTLSQNGYGAEAARFRGSSDMASSRVEPQG